MQTAPHALVVDDNAVILMLAADILEEAGFATLTAYSGEMALRELEEHADRVTLQEAETPSDSTAAI